MSEPATEAGRRLYAKHENCVHDYGLLMRDILAIEQEARADLAAAIEQRLRDQPTPPRLFALSAWDLDCVLGIIREVAYGPVT